MKNIKARFAKSFLISRFDLLRFRLVKNLNPIFISTKSFFYQSPVTMESFSNTVRFLCALSSGKFNYLFYCFYSFTQKHHKIGKWCYRCQKIAKFIYVFRTEILMRNWNFYGACLGMIYSGFKLILGGFEEL